MKKKIETSKLILLASYIITIVLTIILVVGTFLNFDMGNITTITALAWSEVATCNIWYLKKSAKENVPKILGSLPKEILEQIDVNQLLG